MKQSEHDWIPIMITSSHCEEDETWDAISLPSYNLTIEKYPDISSYSVMFGKYEMTFHTSSPPINDGLVILYANSIEHLDRNHTKEITKLLWFNHDKIMTVGNPVMDVFTDGKTYQMKNIF